MRLGRPLRAGAKTVALVEEKDRERDPAQSVGSAARADGHEERGDAKDGAVKVDADSLDRGRRVLRASAWCGTPMPHQWPESGEGRSARRQRARRADRHKPEERIRRCVSSRQQTQSTHKSIWSSQRRQGGERRTDRDEVLVVAGA